MTNEISERVAAAKAEYLKGREPWAKGLSESAYRELVLPADEYIAALETALAAASSERDAAVAALDEAEQAFSELPSCHEDPQNIYGCGKYVGAAMIVSVLRQAARQHDDAAEGSGGR